MPGTPDPHPGPLRVALVNDYEIVLHGLALMLWPYRERVVLTDLDSRLQTSEPVDIALIDTDGPTHLDGCDIDAVSEAGSVGKVVIYSWAPPTEAERRRAPSASAFLAKGLGAVELVAGLERVHRENGPAAVCHPLRHRPATPDWPGRVHGLTHREGEMVALITQGRSNQLIADQTFLSINSVKSYIRTAYRKMEVSSRSQAVLWGLDHGLGAGRRGLGPDSKVRSLSRVDHVHHLCAATTAHADRKTS